jgi:hypothetical protein
MEKSEPPALSMVAVNVQHHTSNDVTGSVSGIAIAAVYRLTSP